MIYRIKLSLYPVLILLVSYLPQILKTVGITNANSQAGLNGGLSIWSFLVGLIACIFVDRLGRRRIWIMAYSWMFFCYIFIIALSATYARTLNKNAGSAVVAFLFLVSHALGCATLLTSLSFLISIMLEQLGVVSY